MKYGWCLASPKWQSLRYELSLHPAWRTTPLLLANSPIVPTSSGVYALFAPPAFVREPARRGLLDVIYAPVYVGRSDDLRRRFLEHCRRPQERIEASLRAFSGLDFWFCPVSRDATRSLESQLIECLGPAANRVSGIVASIGPAQPA